MAIPHLRFSCEDSLRRRAVAIADYACNGAVGRVLGDPVYDQVTEGRAGWSGYSACGDLPHYLLGELGLRDESVVNRDDDGGAIPWKPAVNLSRLVFGTGDSFVWAKATLRPKPGDILYVSPPEHVCVLKSLDESAQTITSFNYGLWDSATNKPSGKERTEAFSVRNGALYVGSRALRGWLDLARIFDVDA